MKYEWRLVCELTFLHVSDLFGTSGQCSSWPVFGWSTGTVIFRYFRYFMPSLLKIEADTLDALSRQSQSLSLSLSVSNWTIHIALCTLHLPDTLHVLSRHIRCTIQTPSIISRQHSDTTQYLPEPNWAKPIKSGPSRHLPGTFQTRFRDLPDTLQTPFRHLSDTPQTPTNMGKNQT